MAFFKRKEETIKELKAYVSGSIIPITEVADPVFSSKAMGDGIAIRPEGNQIIAPCNAEISMVAETGHAIGLKLNNGAELLIHIGIDTVTLNGQGFHVTVKQGKKIKQGAVILEFDKELIEQKGFATDCIMVLTNVDDFPDVKFVYNQNAVKNQTVICTF